MIPMTPLFRACERILAQKLVPIHYDILTHLAIRLLDLTTTPSEERRAKEDVREKMLEARRYGTFYVPKPDCLGAIQKWFQREKTLFNVDAYAVHVEANATLAVEAATELVMRRPYLLTKVNDCFSRWQAAARGYVIEKHVAAKFKNEWPEFYRPAANEGRWDEWCDHDFQIHVGGHRWLIDAMGPRRDGLFGKPRGGGKRNVDFHIAASICDSIVIHGFRRGKDFTDDPFGAEQTEPLSSLLVFLNCYQEHIDWEHIKSYAKKS